MSNEAAAKTEFEAWWGQLGDTISTDPKVVAYIAWKASREYLMGFRFAPNDVKEPLRYTVPVVMIAGDEYVPLDATVFSAKNFRSKE